MCNRVQALHCKVHLICVQLCATMKVICVQLTGRRAADQLSPLFPTFPPPPSHKNAWSALTPQLLLLSFCDPPYRPPIGHWPSSDPTWLAAPTMLCNRRCLRPRWLAFPGTLQSNRQQLLYVLLCYFFSFLVLVWAFLSLFFSVFLNFLVYVFAWIILTCFHNFSASCTCTYHMLGNWGLFIKKLTSDLTIKWGHCFILWHATRIAWITRQIYCLKSLPLAQIQKKRNLSKLREG